MATTKRERQKAARRQKLEQQKQQAKKRQNIRRAVIVAIVAIVVLASAAYFFSGNSGTTTSTTTSTASTTTTAVSTTTVPKADAALQTKANALAVAAGCPASTATRVNTLQWKTSPAMAVNKSLPYYAHFVTTAGDFVVKLDAATAPITVNNFVFLAEHKYYNCVIFHRVIPGFVVQGGDPTGLGNGSPGYTIKDELPKTGSPTYPLYSVAMANTGAANSGGAQFFIVTGKSGEALPASYSLFGEVVSGQSAVMTINNEGSTAGVPPNVTNRMLTVTISNSAS
jgi:cyclophilin family peptidyl-prolyl cis-trans isomerase